MALACPECGFELKPAFFESSDFRNCQICGVEVSATPFPACFADSKTITAMELDRGEDETSCFHHDSKKAIADCTRCGKFLCALCAVEVGSDVLCPECLVSGEQKASDPRLERERTLYDSIALTIAILPAMTISLSILGAPAAMYVALRYWRRPSSLVRRFGWRKYAAVLIALAQLAFWAVAIGAAIMQPRVAR